MGARNKLPSPTTNSFTRIFDVTHVRCDHSPAWLPLYVHVLRAIYILPCSIHVYRCYKHFYDNRNALLTNQGLSPVINHPVATWRRYFRVFDHVTTCFRDRHGQVDHASIYVIFQAIIFVKTLHRISNLIMFAMISFWTPISYFTCT